MTLTHDSSFDLGSYVKLVESFWDGLVNQQTFCERATALGADPSTIATVISNMRQMDNIDE